MKLNDESKECSQSTDTQHGGGSMISFIKWYCKIKTDENDYDESKGITEDFLNNFISQLYKVLISYFGTWNIF